MQYIRKLLVVGHLTLPRRYCRSFTHITNLVYNQLQPQSPKNHVPSNLPQRQVPLDSHHVPKTRLRHPTDPLRMERQGAKTSPGKPTEHVDFQLPEKLGASVRHLYVVSTSVPLRFRRVFTLECALGSFAN